MAKSAEDWCEARGMCAKFSVRADEAAREGTAIVLKLNALSLQHDKVRFHTCNNSKCTVAEFITQGKREKLASVYLPTVPSERLQSIQTIKASGLLSAVTVLGADHTVCLMSTWTRHAHQMVARTRTSMRACGKHISQVSG